MAKAKKSKRKPVARRPTRSTRAVPTDAIALLKADHRQVEEWFEQFESSGSNTRKQELARKVCQALKVHTQIEEEIFYPSFLQATEEEDIHHEAEVEHEGAKRLIADIEASGPDDEYFDAKVKVLSEMIKHHVNEEEQRGGMFAKARQSDMDLKELGERLAARKAELMNEAGNTGEARSSRGSRKSTYKGAGTMLRASLTSHR
jgi:hemerythrin superfamily protein